MGHTYSNLLAHVIFSTKRRRTWLEADVRARLHEYLGGIARRDVGRALAIGGTSDHVHALLSLRPDVPCSHAMMKLKSLSSGWIHREFPALGGFAWQSGYAAFSVSQSQVGRVQQYIADQVEHHRTRTFEEELAMILERHGLEYMPVEGG
ncbi:MAG: IS200/IS605 family transposase [Phycisphaerae bacterium]